MTSDQLNKAISELECEDAGGFEAFGGKPVPYIGWFWRNVDFDRTDGYYFGVMPSGVEMGDRHPQKVGFMENNKWDYDTVHADAGEWAAIKDALEAAVASKDYTDFETANTLIQALGEKV